MGAHLRNFLKINWIKLDLQTIVLLSSLLNQKQKLQNPNQKLLLNLKLQKKTHKLLNQQNHEEFHKKNQVHSMEKVLLDPQRKNLHRKKKNLELNERESGEWKMMMIINQHQKTLNQHLPNKNRALMFLFERSIFLMNQILIVKMKKRNRKAKKGFFSRYLPSL